MLRLLHDVCIISTISSYELGTILCQIVMVNMEFYIIKLIARKFTLCHHLFKYQFRFFAFLLTSQFWVYFHVHISLVFVGFINLQSFTICRSFLVLNYHPHACCGQDMLVYNCHSCKQILIIVLNKMPSF